MQRFLAMVLLMALAAGCSQGVDGRADSSAPPVAVDLSPQGMKKESQAASDASAGEKKAESPTAAGEEPAPEDGGDEKQ